MKSVATCLFALVLLASAAGAASARSHYYAAPYDPYAGAYEDQDNYNPNEGLIPGVRQADGRACVRQCPNDMLPCDPPEFKRADGRCSGRIN